MGAVCGTNVVRVFGKTAASTGLTVAGCRNAGLESRAVFVEASSHASYYPGADSMTLKLVYAPSGRILGAQAVGGKGVDKRIDVIATAIHFGGNVTDLADVDLAYAPPFGSAKDPVHMAAFVACNDLVGRPQVVSPETELEDYQVVDVRTADELRRLPLSGAIHAPLDELPQRFAELDPQRPTVTVCHSGKRAHVAACLLKDLGFQNVRNLTGGMLVRSRTTG
jgi:rhodanese-related sulfurtransferase